MSRGRDWHLIEVSDIVNFYNQAEDYATFVEDLEDGLGMNVADLVEYGRWLYVHRIEYKSFLFEISHYMQMGYSYEHIFFVLKNNAE